MRNLKQAVLAFVREDEGLTVVEYAIAGGMISVLVATAFSDLGEAVLARIVQLIAAVNGTP